MNIDLAALFRWRSPLVLMIARFLIGSVLLAGLISGAQGQPLDETWTVTVGGQSVQVNADGSFVIPNVSAADQFGSGGPGTGPDFLSDDFVRLSGYSSAGGQMRYCFSEPFQFRGGITSTVGPLTFTDIPPPRPRSLSFGAPPGVLTELAQTAQLVVTATLADGSTLDVTPHAAWTIYRTSNVAIATVSADGLVTATGRGIAFITAVNDGATAVTPVAVVPGDPLTTVIGFVRDAQGLPQAGVVVKITGFGGTATTGANGSFTIADVPTSAGEISVAAQEIVAGGARVGRAGGLTPVLGGFTDAGLITMRPAVAWTSTVSGPWDVASNWSTGAVPGATDDVFISVAGDVTITHASGTTTIASLYLDNPFVLSGGTLTVTGTLQANVALTLDGGTLRGARILSGGGPLEITARLGTLDGVTLAGELAVDVAGSVTVSNGLTLDGGLVSLLGNATIRFFDTQTLGGSGAIAFAGTNNLASFLRVVGTSSAVPATLTIGPGVLIHGTQNGTISPAAVGDSVRLEGVINADTATRTIRFLGQWTNAGVLAATNGGALELGGTFTFEAPGTYDASGGSINVSGVLDNTGHTLTLNPTSAGLTLIGGTIRGGRIVAAAGVSLNSGSGTLDGVTLAGDVTIAPNQSLIIEHGLTLDNARLILDGYVGIYARGTQTIGGTGEVVFAGVANASSFVSANGDGTEQTAAVLTIGPDVLVHGPQTGEFFSTYAFDRLINRGTISADTAARSITIGGTWSNAGLLRARNGGVLNLAGEFTFDAAGSFDATGGVINITGLFDNTGGTLTLNAASGGLTVSSGTVKGGRIVAAGGAALGVNFGTLDGVTLGSDLTVPSNQTLFLRNGLTLDNARLILDGYATVSARGTQTLGGTGEVMFGGPTDAVSYLYAFGQGSEATATVLTIGPGIVVHGPEHGQIIQVYSFDRVINQGTIDADTANRTISLDPGVSNTGTIAASAGTIALNSAPPNTGTIAIGAGGTVTAAGGFTNAAGGTIRIAIAGPLAAEFGRLTVNGAAALDGTLAITTTAPYAPLAGASFGIVTSTTLSGTFATLTGAAIGNGNQYSPAYAPSGVTLNVVAVGGSPQVAPDDGVGGHRIVNFSALDSVPAGGNDAVVLSGFVLKGAGTSRILVRAAGPGLAAFDVPQRAANPFVRVYDSAGNQIAGNDTWDAALADTFTATGAFPLERDSADAALVLDLAAGLYHVEAGESDGAGGNLIVEIYEVPSGAASPPQLVNLSVRGRLEPGDLLVPGFVLTGTTPVCLLVRAVGPGLRAFGITDGLADPRLTVFGADGEVIATNDDWAGDKREVLMAATFRAVGAFALNAGSKDAAVVVDAAPGSTTLQVEGDGAGGAVLVEVYVVAE